MEYATPLPSLFAAFNLKAWRRTWTRDIRFTDKYTKKKEKEKVNRSDL